MTDWTRAHDLIIGVAYKESGLAVTEPLIAAMPQHDMGSIRSASRTCNGWPQAGSAACTRSVSRPARRTTSSAA